MKYLWLLSCKFLWGAEKRVTLLRIGFTWERAPCQVVRRAVKLTVLSSKSICTLCVAFGVQGTHLAVYSCVQFALTADWEALGSSNPY